MTNTDLIVAILSTLAAVVLLVGRLWQTLRTLIREKRYSKLFTIVAEAMVYVESLSDLSGGAKKAKVMEMTEEAAKQLGIAELDRERISELIETVIRLTKQINVKSN